LIVPLLFSTLVVGIALYFFYGYSHSTLRRGVGPVVRETAPEGD
jgi:hypothetical protein